MNHQISVMNMALTQVPVKLFLSCFRRGCSFQKNNSFNHLLEWSNQSRFTFFVRLHLSWKYWLCCFSSRLRGMVGQQTLTSEAVVLAHHQWPLGLLTIKSDLDNYWAMKLCSVMSDKILVHDGASLLLCCRQLCQPISLRWKSLFQSSVQKSFSQLHCQSALELRVSQQPKESSYCPLVQPLFISISNVCG